MTTNDLREKYLDFFSTRGHTILPSASLVPENDPTTLFTGSGMQAILPYLLGQHHPAGVRLTDSQKCFRSQDVEEVGDNRHTTFFEMLGNWSLGDYFKAEQIPWFFEFVTKEIGLDPKHIYVSCFRGNPDIGIPKDTESAELWQKEFEKVDVEAQVVDFPDKNGMQGGRIFYYDEKKNWWSRAGVPGNMPIGEPGGPDTEMFWDFGPSTSSGQDRHDEEVYGKHCHVNCDCGRFMEIGNSVFMQYQRTDKGFVLLKQQNVDFGGGLERIAAAKNGNMDVFLIDLFDGMRAVLEKVSMKKYGADETQMYAFRVIFDHLRAATFLIGDGVFPSNKDQGYFVRRLIRRAIRFSHKLGVKDNFCGAVAEAVIAQYEDAYPNLVEKKDYILNELTKEEQKFRKTLEQGIKRFAEFALTKDAGYEISAFEAFDLYQTYGFPIEITEELAKERGLKIDLAGFTAEKEKHQALSRQGSEQKFKGGLADHSDMSVKYHTATHLLHAAVLKILGPHAVQKGSNITPERLRFDFAHPDKLTPEQIKAVEDLVNAAIERDYPMSFQILPLEEARKKKAIGLFGEKYGETVKVYTVGDPDGLPDADPSAATFSREFCGGPHVEHTGVIGTFKIVKEEAVSAGVRRIKAVVE